MRQTESSHLASCPPQPPRLLLGVAEHSTKRAFSEACRRSLLAKGGPARLWQGGEQRSFATISASDVRQGTFLLLDGERPFAMSTLGFCTTEAPPQTGGGEFFR